MHPFAFLVSYLLCASDQRESRSPLALSPRPGFHSRLFPCGGLEGCWVSLASRTLCLERQRLPRGVEPIVRLRSSERLKTEDLCRNVACPHTSQFARHTRCVGPVADLATDRGAGIVTACRIFPPLHRSLSATRPVLLLVQPATRKADMTRLPSSLVMSEALDTR
jgi:hypothetical protein